MCRNYRKIWGQSHNTASLTSLSEMYLLLLILPLEPAGAAFSIGFCGANWQLWVVQFLVDSLSGLNCHGGVCMVSGQN